MLIRDKSGGPLLQAELEAPFGSGPTVLMADNGHKTFEIEPKSGNQFYKLVSATKSELAALKKAGFSLPEVDDFEAREG
jgi:hypothetical protein